MIKVTCIDNREAEKFLTVGKQYNAISSDGEELSILTDDMGSFHTTWASRFELFVSRPQEPERMTWRYNEKGHIEVWRGAFVHDEMRIRRSDKYLQYEEDIRSFLNHIGLKLEDIQPGRSTGTAFEKGYFH